MAIRRRDFLNGAATALFPLVAHCAAAAPDAAPRRLIVILLRGAVDGLNVVIPYREDTYYHARPSIAIAPPGKPDGALVLDGQFAMHPALASLMPLWADRRVAFIHAAGSPDPTRSHFDAQLYLENATPGDNATREGWMNRLLLALPGPHGAADAVSIGPVLPRIFAGKAPVATLSLGPRGPRALPIDQPQLGSAFERLYGGDDALSESFHEARAARAQLMDARSEEQRIADNGAPPAAGFPGQAARLASLIRRHPGLRLAAIGLGGWDTHVNQGGHKGQLADHLRRLGEGLAVLARASGEAWRDTVVVVLSEFGRTVRENGNGGTDHGHGNVIWVLGGGVNGGRVYGEWPGLAPSQLYQRRDLAVTTDFRSLLAAILERHMRLDDRRLEAVIPAAPPAAPDLARIIAV